MCGMESMQKSNYVSTKFAIDNLKLTKAKILKPGGVLMGFALLDSGKELVTKEYYDTIDFFFAKNGIIINKNIYKGNNMATLVVRHQQDKQRIAFLSNMPDVFEMQIPVKDNPLKYVDFMTKSIGELIPYGLNVDVKSTLFKTIVMFYSKKLRERYRYISITGLKVTIYFSKAEYASGVSRNNEKMLLLEINSDSLDHKADYDNFIKKIKFDHPDLIELEGSDYLLGKSVVIDK